jgi:hypothetical protein
MANSVAHDCCHCDDNNIECAAVAAAVIVVVAVPFARLFLSKKEGR